MKHPFLISAQIYLRPLEHEDAPRIVPWLNDPEVTRTLAMRRPVNVETEQAFIAKLYTSDQDLVLGIALTAGDELIGATGLECIDATNRHARFGIFIGKKSAWGAGHGTAATALMLQHAFETLNLHRVWLHVFEHNARAIRIYEKLGFQREGVLRQEVYRDGRYWDVITMAMLRPEWRARR